MGVSNNGWFAEDITHDQVGTFASDTWKCEKGIKVTGDVILVFFMKDFHTGTDVSGLTFTQTARLNNGLDFLW